MNPFLLHRVVLNAQDLATRFPPQFKHRNKLAIFARCVPQGATYRGSVTVSRWSQRPVAEKSVWAETRVDVREDAYTYEPSPEVESRPTVVWHVNFAHTILFVAYGGPLFAQDEMQVTEHPILASVREFLKSESTELRGVTRENGVATPILLRGVERHCAVSTDQNLAENRVYGLYGNAFARASVDTVLRATRVLDPPTVTNLVAIEAPSGASGPYTHAQIEDVFNTAYSGFSSARDESMEAMSSADTRVVVHTGHWGTGAYGGNRELMAMLQILAAKAAHVDNVVFHAMDVHGAMTCQKALARVEELTQLSASITQVLDAIYAMNFQWGVSDGN
jgi:hypothetical protein